MTALLGGALACDRRAAPTPTPVASASVTASASASPPASASAPASAEPVPGAGGPWVGCYANFRPTSTPLRDVTRLSLLCGPATGMQPIAPPWQGTLGTGQDQVHAFSLEAGQCVRVFAVGDATVDDLDLAVSDPRGVVIGSDGVDDRWPVLPADGTLCASQRGAHTLRVTMRRGAGLYAAQAWRLP